MREEIINKFGEGQLELQCVDECCSSCDIKDKRDFNAKEAIRLLLQAVLDLGLIRAYKDKYVFDQVTFPRNQQFINRYQKEKNHTLAEFC